MKVLLHGATNTSNFGDVLFARLVYKKCLDAGFESADFVRMPRYGVGEFVRRELSYTRRLSLAQMLKRDMLILIPGGYFGEDKGSFRSSAKRFLRYVFPALLFSVTGKPICILGVGGGPLSSPILRKFTVKLWNRALRITVRDEETAEYFKKYGVVREITVTSDASQVVTPALVPPFERERELRERFGKKKLILLHLAAKVERGDAFADNVVPALRRFLSEHPDYALAVSADIEYSKDTLLKMRSVQALGTDDFFLYEYHDCMQFCALLNTVSLIITPKLHAGIVGAALGKSVISFPLHREKTRRYYRQIGEDGRCTEIDKLTPELAYMKLNEYYDKPITLSSEIRSLAESNLTIIDELV